ncbi:hypothetical protein Pres01_54040 [Metapseudomonas resinovorans]|nr:hypothetical protein Pres01_54040 [Pseudomonas resinovorans]
MANPFNSVTRIADKTGSLGVLVSAMGCALCFPALASLGAAIGLGFLSQWDGLFITTLPGWPCSSMPLTGSTIGCCNGLHLA